MAQHASEASASRPGGARSETPDRLEFRGGWGTAFIPVGIFLFFCILYFIVFQAFEMYALAMGALVALLVGALFVKKGQYERFWEAAYTGAKESNPNPPAPAHHRHVLGAREGGQHLGRLRVARRHHRRGRRLLLRVHLLRGVRHRHGDGVVARHDVHLLPHLLPRRRPARLRTGRPGRGHRERRHLRRQRGAHLGHHHHLGEHPALHAPSRHGRHRRLRGEPHAVRARGRRRGVRAVRAARRRRRRSARAHSRSSSTAWTPSRSSCSCPSR